LVEMHGERYIYRTDIHLSLTVLQKHIQINTYFP